MLIVLNKLSWYETIANEVLVTYGAKRWKDFPALKDEYADLYRIQKLLDVIYKLDLYYEGEDNGS